MLFDILASEVGTPSEPTVSARRSPVGGFVPAFCRRAKVRTVPFLLTPMGNNCILISGNGTASVAMYVGRVTANRGCCTIFHFYVFLPHE